MNLYRTKAADIIPPAITASAKDAGVQRDVLHHIDLDRLRPSPDNPRTTYAEDDLRQLADSLKAIGQQQPITVYWSAKEQAYVIVSGHSRYHAAKLAGLQKLMAVVHAEDLDKQRQLARRLAENTARNAVPPLECARAVQQLVEAPGMTQELVGKMLGRSQAWVSGQLRLLALPAAEQAKLAAGELAVTDARAAAVQNPRKRRRGPKRVQLTAGGIQVVITFKKQADQCAAVEALERVRQLAVQHDQRQRRDAA
jgi:ParB family chromosome partitioning protein